MSIKRMFETAPYFDALSDLCHNRKRLEIAIRRHTGVAAAGHA
ncbi:MAG TPA: hypothetical protein VMO76_11305 [Candidatus Udaeobacter sp.]|jgi:hypothetical protein|nr:hypothetical protein [Candidatus Udaeobacter sp.]